MEEVAALLFGAVIILFFSYERFNLVTNDGGQQLKRLISILSPDKLRARRTVFSAYLFYAGTLEIIYLFLCVYAKLLPILGAPDFSSKVGASKIPNGASETAIDLVKGFDQAKDLWTQLSAASNAAATANSNLNLGISPTVSLSVALIIVGLAPSFPLLQRFEDWMRRAAHRLAGIPTYIISVAEDLRRNDSGILGDGPHTENLLVPAGNWERLELYQKASNGQLTAPDDFKRNLQLIFAVFSWILDRRLKTRNSRERQRFDRLEDELRRRTGELVLQLDEKSGYRLGSSPEELTEDDDQETGELKRATWERLAESADELGDDLYILLALFVEHEIVVFDGASAGAMSRQQGLAAARLKAFLGSHATPTQVHSYTMVSLGWTAGITVLISLLWGFVLGGYEYELQFDFAGDVYLRTINYVFSASVSLFMPVLVALALRDAGLQSRNWHNVWDTHWTVRLPQTAFVFLMSWAVASLFRIGLALWQTVVVQRAAGDEFPLWPSIRASFEYNAPTTVRGAVLGLVVIGLLDARLAASSKKTPPTSFLFGARAAAIMAFWGGVTRYMTARSAAANAVPPRLGLDEIDRGLIVYSILFSALVGFFVAYCVAEAVFASRGKVESGASGQNDQAGASDGAPSSPPSDNPAAGE